MSEDGMEWDPSEGFGAPIQSVSTGRHAHATTFVPYELERVEKGRFRVVSVVCPHCGEVMDVEAADG